MTNFMKFIEDNILYEILVAEWLLVAWNFYLTYRQKCLMKRYKEIPTAVEGIMTKKVYDKAYSYYLDNLNFGIFDETFQIIFSTVFLLTLCYHRFWQWSAQLSSSIGLDPTNDILRGAVCMFIINVISNVCNLPFKVYRTFVLEERHGFNKQKPLFFVKDQLLKFLVLQLLSLPLLCAVIWIVDNGGDYFFMYLWVFIIVATLFLMILYPEVIAPLFDKYTPLPEGELKQKIEALATSVKFPLYKLFLVEGSKRSSHSNAYLYGFHKYKRIVLFDTLVKEYYKPTDTVEKDDEKGCETDEVLAVLAHEIGHWKYNHTLKGFLMTQVTFMVNMLLCAKLLDYAPMYAAFGFTDSQPTFIGLIIVPMYILIPVNTIIQFVSVVIGRMFEFEADKFAQILGHGEPLKRALIKLHKDNLGYPLFDRIYSSWHHNHPPILERLEAIDKTE